MTDNPNIARPLDAFAIALALVICVSWGFNQVAMKLAMTDIPPLTQSAARSALATVLVGMWARLRGIALFERDGTLWAGLAAGVLFALEFGLIYVGLLWTTVSRAVLFIYLAPFFVVIGARWFLPGDHFRLSQWAGLALSFAGMALAFGVPAPAADPRQMLGDVMMVVAAAAWAATTLVIKASALNRVSFEKATLYQLVVSAPLLGLCALIVGERLTGVPSVVAVWAMAYQIVWVVSITFMAWFALIQRYSASRLSAFSFVTPLCGVAAGHFVLGEPLTPAFLLAAALVAAGLVLVNRAR